MYLGFAFARACGYIRPPPRESSATRVFYSNFRSAYLNSTSFFLLLFVREWLSRRLFCAPTWYARIASRICACMCVYMRALQSTSCSPSEFHPLFHVDPRCQSERVTVVSRATASPTRAGNLHTRVHSWACALGHAYSHEHPVSPYARFTLDRLPFLRERKSMRRSV